MHVNEHIYVKKENISSALEVGLSSLLVIIPCALQKTTTILTSNH